MTPSRSLLVVGTALALGAVLFFTFFPLDDAPGPDAGPTVGSAATTQAGGESSPRSTAVGRTTEAGPANAVEAAGERRVVALDETQPTRPGEEGVQVTGRLVDAAGRPQAGVELAYRRQFGSGNLVVALPDMNDDNLLESETDSAGRFQFDVEPGSGGRLTIASDSNRLFEAGPSRVHQIPAFDSPLDLGDLIVLPGATVSGRVVDDTGAPIAGARVRSGSDSGLASWRPGRPDTVTGSDGRFEIAGLEPGRHSVSASCAGFVPGRTSAELSAGQRQDGVTVVLETGNSVAGTVVDDRGRPIAGARVAAWRQRTAGPGIEVTDLDADEAVETDAAGRFVLSGLEGDTVQIASWHDDHQNASQDGVEMGSSDTILRMNRLATVSGILVDRSDRPLEGSVINALTAGQREGIVRFDGDRDEVRTDAEGRFELTGVLPGSALLVAEGNRTHLRAELPCEVGPGESVENLRIVAERGASLAVRVLGPDGAPIEGALVTANPPSEEPTVVGNGIRTRSISMRRDGGGRTFVMGDDESLGSATTDADGEALLEGLRPGDAVALATHAEFAPSTEQAVRIPRTGSAEATLELRPAGFVSVRVVDPDGEPVADASVVVRPLDPSRGSPELRGTTTASGDVRLGPLLPGRYTAQLQQAARAHRIGNMSFMTSTAGGDDLEGARADVRIVAGETAEVEIAKPVLTRVYGQVRGAEGPVAGIEVELRAANTGPFGGGMRATTDATGNYALDDVTPGSYEVLWRRSDDPVPHRGDLEVPAALPELLHDLVLTGGEVRVRVLDSATGAPLAGARVALREPTEAGTPQVQGIVMMSVDVSGSGASAPRTSTITAGDGPRPVTTGADGVAVLKGVPVGSYELSIESDGRAPLQRSDVAVRDGQLVDLGDLPLAEAGVVTGQLTGFTEDDPIRAAMVRAERVDAESEPRRTFAQGEQFRLDDLEPGTWEIWATPVGQGPGAEGGKRQTVVVLAGEPVEVTLPVR